MKNTVNQDELFNTDHLKFDLKKRTMRGAGATVFSGILSFMIQFFGAIILARLLTPDDFGLIAMVTAFSLLLQNFGLNGFTEAVIQKEDLTHEMMSTLFWLNTAISFCLMLLFMISAPVMAWFYREPRLTPITIGIAFSIFASGLATLHMAIIRRNMQFYLVSSITVIARAVSVIVAIILALVGSGYWALVANTVAYPLVCTIGAWFYCHWCPGLPDKIKDIMSMLKYALHTYGNFTLNYFARNIDKLLIGWRYGAQSLGFYKKAYDLFSLPANQLTAPLSNVALASLSRLVKEPQKYRQYYLNAISTITFVGMALSGILTLAGRDIIIFVLGPQWAKAGDIFCYFGASIGIMLIHNTQGWLHLSLGRPDRWVRWGIFETIFTTIAFIISLPFGIAGVATAYTITYYIIIFPALLYAGKPINLNLSSIISATWKFFVAALIATEISYIILFSFGATSSFFNKLNILIRIISSSFLCLFLYLALIVIHFRSLQPITKFISTVHQMLPGKSQSDINQ